MRTSSPYVIAAAILVLSGCLPAKQGVHKFELKIEESVRISLEGLDYRMRRLPATEVSTSVKEDRLFELRRDRDQLEQALRRTTATDDTLARFTRGMTMLRQLEDLLIRYESFRIGPADTVGPFLAAAEKRFTDLDKELVYLEADLLAIDASELNESIAQMYRLRNDLALTLASSDTLSKDNFDDFKRRVTYRLGDFDVRLAHLTTELDRLYGEESPMETLSNLWL